MAPHLPNPELPDPEIDDRNRKASSGPSAATATSDPDQTNPEPLHVREALRAIVRLLARQAGPGPPGAGRVPMTAETSGAPDEPVCRRLLEPVQAADAAGVPLERICHWIATRKLRVYRLAGGPRIDEVELADLLSSL